MMEKGTTLHPVLTLLLVTAGLYILDCVIHVVFPMVKLATIFVLVLMFARPESRDSLIRLASLSYPSQRLPSLSAPFTSFGDMKELFFTRFRQGSVESPLKLQESKPLSGFQQVAT
ncbi:hypothetical protein LZ30DRAFT_694148 [Colletotrichum cereale]|nr:hypothetical protein LZ30DRAFT_694148 [Colletotrichum cereale]